MLNIDFSNIKNIDKKLSQSEILALNKIFSDPKIQQKLVEIEENRKIRFRNRIFIFIVACFLSFLFLFFNKPNGLNFGIFLINFIPCSLILLFVYVVGDYFINKKLTGKIEKSLKKEILPKIALSLYSEINYDHGEKYSFVSELGFLEENNFIEYYTYIQKNENSIRFSFKNFLVNGFKIKTTGVSGGYKSSGTTIKDYCYLTKIELPKDENFFPKIIILKSSFREKNFLKSIAMFLSGFGLFLPFFYIFFIGGLDVLIDVLDDMLLFGVFVSIFFIISIFSDKKTEKFKKIKIQNPEFNKKFQIFCEDENLANTFANSILLQKIAEFSTKNKIYYDFLFFENKIFIKRHISGNFLDINFNFNVTKNPETYLDFYLDMKEIFEIISIFAEENKK